MMNLDSKEKYIDIKKVISGKNKTLAKWMPGFMMRYIKRIAHEDDINEIMNAIGHLHGLDFVRAGLDQLDTEVIVKGIEYIPPTGGCILAANHPLGGLDGVAFLKAVGMVRNDMKFLVNDVLLNIENFHPLFLPVNKHGSNPRKFMKLIDEAYASEEATLVFPAGLVSRKLSGGVIADLEWKKSFISKAIKYKREVIPVHIDGRNSNFFYNLSKIRNMLGIRANVEMFYLADEMFNQRGKSITVTFHKPIPYTTFDDSKTQQQWADYVRAHVYETEKNKLHNVREM